MSEKNYLAPTEMLNTAINSAVGKVSNPFWKQFIFGFLAGAFIAFAAAGSNMAAHMFLSEPSTFGLGRFIACFPCRVNARFGYRGGIVHRKQPNHYRCFG